MSITLILEGDITPKARPKVTINGTFMPRRYRDWKSAAILSFRSQYQGQNKAITRTKLVTVLLVGKHNRRGDADNIAGAILDALVQADIIANDNLLVVPKLSIELIYDKKLPPMCTIEIGL